MDFSPSGVAGNPLHFLLNCLIRKKLLRIRGHAWENPTVNPISLQTMKFFRNNFSNILHVDGGEFTISENQEPDPFKVKAFAKNLLMPRWAFYF